MVTTYDIAEKAGVSQATVSLVLNKSQSKVQISEKTRQRVLEAAADLGYRRNGSARAMSSGRFGCAALLTSPQPHYSYIPQGLLQSIHEELATHDLHLHLAMLTDDKLTDSEFVPKILREWLADGLLIDYIKQIPERLVELVLAHRLPAIWINVQREHDCVHPDDREAGYRATKHLIGIGHSRILYADPSHGYSLETAHYSARDRRHGYQSAMADAGLDPWTLALEFEGGQREQLMPFALRCLKQPDRPTAIVSYSHPDSFLIAALMLGLDVPRELSVISFGTEAMKFGGRPVTAMTEPNEAVGRSAVRMLLDKIDSPHHILEPRSEEFGFSEGVTCAPPAGIGFGARAKVVLNGVG